MQYTGTDRSEDNSTTVDNFLKQDKSISHSTNSNHMKNHNLTANAYLEWKIDSVTNLVGFVRNIAMWQVTGGIVDINRVGRTKHF